MTSPRTPDLRFDGVINIPTIIAMIAAVVGLGSAVASATTVGTDNQRRITLVEQKYEDIPERLATLEANQKSQTDTLRRIETKLDVAMK